MTLPHRKPDRYRVSTSEKAYSAAIFEVRKDVVEFADQTSATRETVVHGGAVGVVAIDDELNVVLLEQYRHSVGEFLWELPAGILDVAEEPAVDAARRELAEEVALMAERWDLLIDIVASPGFSSERVRVFLARGLSPTARPDGFTVQHEEADLVVRRVPIDDCVAAVHDGSIVNSIAVGGVLAAERALRDESLLRAVDTAWPGAE